MLAADCRLNTWTVQENCPGAPRSTPFGGASQAWRGNPSVSRTGQYGKKAGVTQVAQTCVITLRLGRDPFSVRQLSRVVLEEEGPGPQRALISAGFANSVIISTAMRISDDTRPKEGGAIGNGGCSSPPAPSSQLRLPKFSSSLNRSQLSARARAGRRVAIGMLFTFQFQLIAGYSTPSACSSSARHCSGATGRVKYVAPPSRATISSAPQPALPTTVTGHRGQRCLSQRSTCRITCGWASVARITMATLPSGTLRCNSSARRYATKQPAFICASCRLIASASRASAHARTTSAHLPPGPNTGGTFP